MSLNTTTPLSSSTNGLHNVQVVIHSWIRDIQSQLSRFPEDLSIAQNAVEALFNSGLVDDKKYVPIAHQVDQRSN
jgi:hypothetical protein